MSTHKGKPSGINKSEGTGIPSNPGAGTSRKNEELTNEYTLEDKQIAGPVRKEKPNRNTDKVKAGNTHGYKN